MRALEYHFLFRSCREGVVVIPRHHVADIRQAVDPTAAAVIVTVAHVSRAVNKVLPNDGLSVWHSTGEGTNQEVPHLHFHVHPRFTRDDLLRVYPRSPELPPREAFDRYTKELRQALR